MKRRSLVLAVLIALGFGGAIGLATMSGMMDAVAAEDVGESQTLSFAVENMTCALCPLTVSTAMENVEGVLEVSVDFETKLATVIFDPAIASPAEIAAASTNVGYPAHLTEL